MEAKARLPCAEVSREVPECRLGTPFLSHAGPKDVVETLGRALDAIIADPEFKRQVSELG